MKLRYSTLDVFTDRPFGGNPLAVFCDQAQLPDARMQEIAREFNLSETVFIVPPSDPRALRRLRIFTPASELPFAGHPTIGAVHVLVDEGIANIAGATGDFAVECALGLVPIKVQRRAEGPPFLQLTTSRLPEVREDVPSRAELARLISLNESDIVVEGDFAQAWSCGVPFLFVPVRDREALGRAAPDSAAWKQLLGGAWASQAFVFCRDPELATSNLRARMFAPQFGIAEDPATGVAAAAFAGYLAARESVKSGTLRWVVEQGFEMGRPSLLHVEADRAEGKLTAVRVGGTAVRMSEGTLTVP
ncbi:MAG TPA: PhzF family phenazine biosynthesis protein [Steroidobacteraceae bacterium]|jgi:trans-2,3-dihydro-3-hydroxyanthranilate isomerase